MEIYKLLVEIIKNPNVPRFYRKLEELYKRAEMENESLAFQNLIEVKFNKNVTDN
jgi:hypothetical protein